MFFSICPGQTELKGLRTPDNYICCVFTDNDAQQNLKNMIQQCCELVCCFHIVKSINSYKSTPKVKIWMHDFFI